MTEEKPAAVRIATCSCGALKARCHGEPARVSVCHCLACRRRTGSAFSHNVTFAAGQVTPEGPAQTYRRRTDSGRTATYAFCPACSAIVYYENESRPGQVNEPAGAFADPLAPAPFVELFEERRSPWLSLGIARMNDS